MAATFFGPSSAPLCDPFVLLCSMPRAKAMVLRRPAARRRPVAHLSDLAPYVPSPGEVAQHIDSHYLSSTSLADISFILPSRIQWGPPDPGFRPTFISMCRDIAIFGSRLHDMHTQYEIYGTQSALIERLEAQANLRAVEAWYRRYFPQMFSFEDAHPEGCDHACS